MTYNGKESKKVYMYISYVCVTESLAVQIKTQLYSNFLNIELGEES